MAQAEELERGYQQDLTEAQHVRQGAELEKQAAEYVFQVHNPFMGDADSANKAAGLFKTVGGCGWRGGMCVCVCVRGGYVYMYLYVCLCIYACMYVYTYTCTYSLISPTFHPHTPSHTSPTQPPRDSSQRLCWHWKLRYNATLIMQLHGGFWVQFRLRMMMIDR